MSNDDAAWTDHREQLFERVVHRGRARKRRRALTSVGVFVMVGAVAAFGLYSPSRGHDSLHVANGPNPTTTTTTPPARPGGVLLIGDAVMLGAKSALERAIPEAHVDAGVSRQLDAAIPILDAAKREGPLPPTIVIGLGTNGPSEGTFDVITRDVKQVMDIVGPDSTVFFLTVKVPRPWEAEVNDALYWEAGLSANAHVLAWHDYAQPHPDWFFTDGIHLNPVGQTAYATFIRGAVGPQTP